MRATIAYMKQLEYAVFISEVFIFKEYFII